MSSHNRKEVACTSWPFSLKQLFFDLSKTGHSLTAFE